MNERRHKKWFYKKNIYISNSSSFIKESFENTKERGILQTYYIKGDFRLFFKICNHVKSTGLRTGQLRNLSSNRGTSNMFPISPNSPDGLWDTSSPLFKGYMGSFTGIKWTVGELNRLPSPNVDIKMSVYILDAFKF